jgi:putative Holliday junction resolvase
MSTAPETMTDPSQDVAAGVILALDLGTKRIGVAVSDPNQLAITTVPALKRSNWKQAVHDIKDLVRRFDAKTIVIGFPLTLDGHEGLAATESRRKAVQIAKSLALSTYLQDERLTSREASENLRARGCNDAEVEERIDSEAAAIILRDFIESNISDRVCVHLPDDTANS